MNENAKCKRIEVKQTTCLRLRFLRYFYKNFDYKKQMHSAYDLSWPTNRSVYKISFKRKIALVIIE